MIWMEDDHRRVVDREVFDDLQEEEEEEEVDRIDHR